MNRPTAKAIRGFADAGQVLKDESSVLPLRQRHQLLADAAACVLSVGNLRFEPHLLILVKPLPKEPLE